MKAIRIHAPGGPDVLAYDDIPAPHPQRGEVLVAVRAAGVNHRDIWQRAGNFGTPPEPLIPGSDAAGEVLEVGANVSDWNVGDRVVINPGLSCGQCPECWSGKDNACAQYRIFDGTYAEQLTVPAHRLVMMPSGITFEEAAAIGVPYITAEEALIRAQTLPGQSLLVWGATGGLGLAAVQLGRLRGMRVMAITRNPDKADRLLREGAHEVLKWDGQEDLTAEVQRRTAGRGVDVVLDSLGSRSFRQSLQMAARGGAVVTVGATTGGGVELELGLIFRRRLTIIGAYMGHSGILPRLLTLFARGALKPVIDTVLPLADAAEAHRRMEHADLFGKIVLAP